MLDFPQLESEMTNHAFAIANLFEEIIKEDRPRGLRILGQLTNFLNEQSIVLLYKQDLIHSYDLGLLTKEELDKKISEL